MAVTGPGPLIASGRDADIFAYGDDERLVLRRARSGRSMETEARIMEYVRAEGYPRIILWVLRDNRRARRFYERAGFRRKGTEHPSYFAGGPEVRYVRDL